MPSAEHPPGWYPDPLGFADQRWWDGAQWTDHVAPAGTRTPPHAPPPVPPPPVPPPPVPPPPVPPPPVPPPAPVAAPPPAEPPQPTEPTPEDAPVAPPTSPARDTNEARDRRALLLPSLVALAGLIVGTVGVVMLLGDDDPAPTSSDVAAAILEPAASEGPDPFTDDVAAEPLAVPPELEAPLAEIAESTVPAVPTASVDAPPTAPPADAARGEVVRVRASAPGLYGGTEDNARCDVEQLVDFLAAEPTKSTAWVEALNADPTVRFRDQDLEPDDIGAYVDTLTPVVLLADTLVTNHGFADGRATPREAVLQKGSAVLVDQQGIPRTRCACGNPLTQPSSSVTQVEPQGEPWPGFNPNKVAVIEPLPANVTFLRLLDLETGAAFDRPLGSKGERDVPITPPTPTPAPTGVPTATTAPAPAPQQTTAPVPRPTAPAPRPTPTTAAAPTPTVVLGTGDVQVTLRWRTDSDLDLHVIDPAGAEISFGATTSDSGGALDVDDIPDPGDTGPHVENIFWPAGGAPAGGYQAWVEHYSGAPSDYTLEVRLDGELVHSEQGTLGAGEASPRFSFAR